jgi:hypothetical protein
MGECVNKMDNQVKTYQGKPLYYEHRNNLVQMNRLNGMKIIPTH